MADENKEIKINDINFSEQEYSFFNETGFSQEYKNDTDTSIPTLETDLDRLGFDNYTNTKHDKKKNNEESDLIKINIEKPDDEKVKKYFLAAAIIFFIVVFSIIYHPLYNLYLLSTEKVVEKPLEVEVKNLIYSPIEATGLVTPASSVDIVARVDGYLQETYFKEGDFISNGQLLFKIEPNEYQIAVKAAKASVEQARAVYENSLQELERAKELIQENFISRSDYDSIVATANRDKAALDEVQQSLARAQLNLNYTNIYSPLTGKAGKIYISNGNYVGLSTGALVNIAKTNPINVSFSLKSADIIKLKQTNNGTLDLSAAKVEIILSDDNKYPHIGKINFSDNTVAEDAATLSLKAVFENQENILVPGDYVKVIVTPVYPLSKYLIPQSITHGDALNGYYVWAYKDGVVKKIEIDVLGSRENNWIVNSGISDVDQIVVNSNEDIQYEGVTAHLKGEKQNNKTEDTKQDK